MSAWRWQDYENDTLAYVELHGDPVACVRGKSSDLAGDVFAEEVVAVQALG